ncbi:DNA/RNA non-specific endonuclease [Glaciibacter superstes]|uniref:DNA/RNA non-specific endonuclease n=1 Tax=Glaciibacter superstes TaxID=501023 RepID=UPI0003B4124E|nr:DNA/RNA non-specific endonuclease [Glaciibacter superstes]
MASPSASLGYESSFLTSDVPLSFPLDGRGVIRLDYVHFTVLLDPTRRLAAATGVNIDGKLLVDVARSDGWHLDTRVPSEEQAGPDLYARNDLDRGHLVRRRDPVWGEPAAAANEDTFVYTNAAPQAADFNQSKELWLGLEDYLLGHAETYDTRLSVFTGPVLAPADVVYRGIAIPRMFWKVAVWTTTATSGSDVNANRPAGTPELAATGYLLDQTPQLDDIELERETALAAGAGDPPPLGPYRTFQVPISEIAVATGLDLQQLVAADRLVANTETRPDARAEAAWIPLRTYSDIVR